MHLTIEDALAVYPLSEGKLAAGKKGISRTISSINLMDAPDVINWMKEGELLLTTAYAIRDSPEDFVNLLQKLNERGASGLGIKLGRYWAEIPEIALLEADRLGLPLIELPFQFTFSEQITALYQSEFQRDTRRLNELLETQKKLVDFAMQADEYTNYFQSITSILGVPLAIVTSEGQTLYNMTRCSDMELLSDWPWNQDNRFYKSASNLLYRVPLLKNGKSYGYLLIQTENLLEAHEMEGIFHQAAVILSYHLEVIQNQEATAAGSRLGMAMERYLKGNASLKTVLEFAEALGSTFWSTPYVCMVSSTRADAWDHENQRRKLREIQNRLQDHPKTSSLESHHFYVMNRIYSLFPLLEEEAKDRRKYEDSVRLYADLMHSWEHGTRTCFISKVRTGIEEFIDGFRECGEAERISTELGLSEPIVMFADLEFIYLFKHIPQEVMVRYCSYLFRPLMDKEEEYTSEMMHTLEAYFANNGQVNETARELYIHRNTVLYRLEKISGLLNLDLKNTDHLLLLKLGLMFRHLMSSERQV
ncbi:PucR family transcriptional regulator [Paenibacillus illinoisensis]|uniref:PucR family transcriptional regulator n=1 Tax=Paenibacillus illinoisensis TaxID=59845 RepID=UPI0020419BC0|nr:PucR family transcriptional regulator [Paenibacillus illinoisensis]MCM3203435.1 PucR family transcriptional regulator ligand-binding domain-containing protein [Paenibacillus illinoisensis]